VKNNKEEVIEKLKSLSPLIYNIVMTYDMGYEFSGISKDGIIFSMPGMLLDTSTSGHMPNWYSETLKKKDYSKVEKFFNELDITLYEELSFSDLKNILSDVESINH